MSSNNVRDEFRAGVKKALAYRVSLQCTNPLCRRPTAAPHIEPDKYNLLGEAAHITGARPDGPRYEPAMSRAERCSISNGIWLCRNCARIIDTERGAFPALSTAVVETGSRSHSFGDISSHGAAAGTGLGLSSRVTFGAQTHSEPSVRLFISSP